LLLGNFNLFCHTIPMTPKKFLFTLASSLLPLTSYLLPLPLHAQTQTDWPMAGANPQRTSWTAQPPQNITGITWYRPIEAYIDQKTQLITANGNLYVATSKGLIVLNAETGALRWRFDTELPLGHSPTVIGTAVYLPSYDGYLYKLQDNGSSYQLLWRFDLANAGFSANPLVVNNVVYLGSRDGTFYAINASNGSRLWSYTTGGPIMNSAAFDPADNSIYFASNDLYAYKLNTSGSLVWRSPQKLPGESYQSFWPVIYGNYVVFSSAPAYKSGADPGSATLVTGANLKEMYRAIFFGTSSGNSGEIISNAPSSTGWPSGSRVLNTQNNPNMPYSLASYLAQYPHFRTFPILNKSNGQEPITLPYYYTGTYSGNVYPPIVNPTTNALYMNNVINGQGGTDSIPRTTLMGWKPDSHYLHLVTNVTWAVDEPISFVGSGTQNYYSLCCDRAAGIIGGTSWWSYGGTELEYVLPTTGDAKYDPMWRKYTNALERLGAYYNGFALRTNNTDSRNGVFNSHGLQNPLVPHVFTNAQGQRVDRIFIHRSNTIVALGPSASKTFLPLATINTSPTNQGITLSPTQLRQKLEAEIDKIISVYEANPTNGFLNPGYYNLSQLPAYAAALNTIFESPDEGLYTLAAAYPHLNSTLQTRARTYLQAYYNRYFSATPVIRIGWTNQPRESTVYPPEVASRMSTRGDISSGAFPQRAFYALWKYAQVFPSQSLDIYNRFRSRLIVPANLTSDQLVRTPHLYNEQIAGYYGFLNLQEMAGRATADASLRQSVQSSLNTLLSQRTQNFAKDHPWAGDDNPNGISANQYGRMFNLARNFVFLTPELGDYMRQNNSVISHAVSEYTYLNPLWFTAHIDNAWQEGIKHHLYDNPALFKAKAYVQRSSSTELSKYIDTPMFARGDLYYIQNLVTALEAPSDPNYTPPPTQPLASPTPINYSLDSDTDIDIFDILILISRFTQNLVGDFNQNGRIDIFDFNTLLKNRL
jgi:outer membrane protein assembly factor BamB